MEEKIIHRVAEGPFRYIGWPTVALDTAGNLYVACSGHRLAHICPFGQTWLFVSGDQGKHWDGPVIVNDTVMDDRDAGLLVLPDRSMVLTWFCHSAAYYHQIRPSIERMVGEEKMGIANGLLDYWDTHEGAYGSFLRVSRDGGRTWGETRRSPVTSPHGPTVLHDGSLLYVGKEFHSGTDLEKDGVYALRTTDGGAHFEVLGRVPIPAGVTATQVSEPFALELPDRTVIAFLRLDVEGHMSLAKTFSQDGGKTWLEPEQTGICGGPAHLLLTTAGDLLLTYGRREAPFGECVRISTDGGKTFSEEKFVSHGVSRDLGYPSTVELPDGSFYTVFYQQLAGDSFTSLVSCRWNKSELF